MGARDRMGAAEDKRPTHVRPPLLGRQLGLRPRNPGSLERSVGHRNPPSPRQPAGQQERLVEAALGLARGVKGHRHQTVHAVSGEHGLSSLGQEVTERAGEAGLPAELERVERLPDRAVVEGRRARIREGGWPALAGLAEADAQRSRLASVAPPVRVKGVEGLPAARAVGWAEAGQAYPAWAAEGVTPAVAEASPAQRTERRKQEVKAGGEPPPPTGSNIREGGRRRPRLPHPSEG